MEEAPATRLYCPRTGRLAAGTTEVTRVGLWDWLRYGPFLAQVVVIRRCNLACGYCTEFDKTSLPVPLPDLEARFRKIRGRLEDADGYRERLIRDGRAPYKCRSGSRYLYVDEFGDVHWCSQTREAFSKALLDYDAPDLKRQFHTPKACHETCTLGCSRTASAYDGWRRQ